MISANCIDWPHSFFSCDWHNNTADTRFPSLLFLLVSGLIDLKAGTENGVYKWEHFCAFIVTLGRELMRINAQPPPPVTAVFPASFQGY